MLTHDRRVTALFMAAALPAVVVAGVALWRAPLPGFLRVAAVVVVMAIWAGLTMLAREQLVRPLQTVANLLAALREGDFSIRARSGPAEDALSHVMMEINTLADTLRVQRLSAQEATALLRSVMAEIDVAIFAFDEGHRLVLANRYGERLLGRDAQDLLGRTAPDLGLVAALSATSALQDLTFAGASGRFEIRHARFWQGGAPHELLVLSDLSQPLREQERQAWRRLIRVIGHELNNSLAPIKSIAGSLESLLGRTPPPEDWRSDMEHGLGIIAARADALSRFTTAYARLAKLPPPSRRPIAVGPLVHHVAGIETRLPVQVRSGTDAYVDADPDQLEQLLINLVRNAVDATVETGGRVTIGWTVEDHTLEVFVEDEGPGLQNSGNLFVPLFTTKPGGSGIGLALSRQIAEGHDGTLTLVNRAPGPGARASLRLPIGARNAEFKIQNSETAGPQTVDGRP
jgi:two-component system nitrogen regulation sensor histidine kinase NtrY